MTKKQSEAEWKDAFEKLSPVEQAFLFGLYTGRTAAHGPGAFPIGHELAETVWRLRTCVEDEGTPEPLSDAPRGMVTQRKEAQAVTVTRLVVDGAVQYRVQHGHRTWPCTNPDELWHGALRQMFGVEVA
jgi:hypothetical protein